MCATNLTVPSATVRLHVPTVASAQLRVPDNSVRLVVPSARVALGVPSAAAKLRVGAPIALESVTLNLCILTAMAGSDGAYVSSSMWSHLGKIRYRALDLDTGAGKISPYRPSVTPAKQYLTAINLTLLEPNHRYLLQFWLDCVPDVFGYMEEWRATTITWTHPEDGDDVVIEGQGA